MEINFIITAHDKECYLPYLRKVLMCYQKIKPSYVVIYSGSNKEFPCTLRRPHMPHSDGDLDLTLTGFNHLRTMNDGFRFIKMGIDTLLLDEGAVIEIFLAMERAGACYAGNAWHGNDSESLSTDIIFLDTRFGNPLNPPHGLEKDGADFEKWMWQSMRHRGLKCLNIAARDPVHPNNRMECAKLKWTMHHQLENNVANMNKWGYGSIA